jgi:hypothetical protein
MSTAVLARDLQSVKIGDKVIRMLAGTLPMELIVTDITKDKIRCGDWEFSRRNGAELDADLGWEEKYSGSFLRF